MLQCCRIVHTLSYDFSQKKFKKSHIPQNRPSQKTPNKRHLQASYRNVRNRVAVELLAQYCKDEEHSRMRHTYAAHSCFPCFRAVESRRCVREPVVVGSRRRSIVPFTLSTRTIRTRARHSAGRSAAFSGIHAEC